MTTRRTLLGLLAATPMLVATSAFAADYTPTAFEESLEAGKPILVHITVP